MTITLLFKAIVAGNLRATRRLFEENTNLDVNTPISWPRQQTPLHVACEYGWLQIATFLVEEKQANVNSVDSSGHTPLFLACLQTDLPVNKTMAIAELLLANGADVNTRSSLSGNTALHVTCGTGRSPLIRVLLYQGAHIDSISNRGATPLLYACRYCPQNVEAIRILLTNNANRQIQEHSGDGPADILRERGQEEIIESYDKWPLAVSAEDAIIDKAQATRSPKRFTQGGTMVGLNPHLSRHQHALALKAVLLVRQLPVHEVALEILGFLTPASVETIFLPTV